MNPFRRRRTDQALIAKLAAENRAQAVQIAALQRALHADGDTRFGAVRRPDDTQPMTRQRGDKGGPAQRWEAGQLITPPPAQWFEAGELVTPWRPA